MYPQEMFNVLSPFQNKVSNSTKGWDVTTNGQTKIPASGIQMNVYLDGKPTEGINLRIGISGVLTAVQALKPKEVIIEYFHQGRKLCTVGCKKHDK